MITRIVPGALPDHGYMRLRQIIGGRRRITETTDDGHKVVVEIVDQGVLPISKPSWIRGQQAGRFPRGVKHGAATLYPVQEIRALLERLGVE